MRPVRVAQTICLLALTTAVLCLIGIDKPWELGLAERLDAGKNLTIDQDIALGFFGALLFTTLVSLAGFLSAPWWAAPLPPSMRPPPPATTPPAIALSPRAFWIPVLLAVVLCGALRLPLASKSLWWDETWTLQRVVLGQWERDDENPDSLEWKDRDWQRTFFYYQKPTNHIAFSVLSRASVEAWQAITGSERDKFSEIAFRLPSILAALASVVVIALFARQLGFPRAGVGAAFLLALHPWHIQYGIDGRAFSMVVLLSMLCVMLLIAGVRTVRWPWWFALALCQTLLLWAFPYAIFLCALVLPATLAAVPLALRDPAARSAAIGRFLASNFLTAVSLMFLIGPLVPQLMKWTDKIHGNTMIDTPFLRELAANLLAGMAWDRGNGRGWFGIPTLDQLPPYAVTTAFAVAAALALLGLARACLRSKAFTPVLLAYILVAPFAIWIAYLDTHYFYTRYVIYALPAILLFTAVGATGLAALAPARSRPAVAWTLLTILVVSATWLWSPRIGLLLERPVSPNREVARHIEARNQATPGGILAAGFNLGGRKPDAYFREIRFVDDLADLQAVCALARERGQPLYLFYGYDTFNRFNEPEPFAYLDDPALFTQTAEFFGIEPDFHYKVFRYSGRPLSAND